MFLYQIQAVRIAAFVTEPSDLDMQTFTDKDIEWAVERVTAEHWEIPEMEAALGENWLKKEDLGLTLTWRQN